MSLTEGNCEVCGTSFRSYNPSPRFCSLDCWYGFRTENNIPSGDAKAYSQRAKSLSKWYKDNPKSVEKKCKKQSASLRRRILNGDIDQRKFMGHTHRVDSKLRIGIASRRNWILQAHTHNFPNKYLTKEYYTDIESKMEKILVSKGLKKNKDYYHNKPVKTAKTVRFPDFLLPKMKIIIECDEPFWHKNRFESDSNRDKELRELGFKVFRFESAEIDKGLVRLPL